MELRVFDYQYHSVDLFIYKSAQVIDCSRNCIREIKGKIEVSIKGQKKTNCKKFIKVTVTATRKIQFIKEKYDLQ